MTGFLKRLCLCAALVVLAQQAFAAVLILEGSAPPPPAGAPPITSNPAQQKPEGSAPPPAALVPLNPANPESSGPGPTSGAPAKLSPNSPSALNDFAGKKIANPAELSVEMTPGYTVNVGTRVGFRIKSKKAGYLVLFDVDSTGRLTQIYPNTASLLRSSRPNGNYIKPGGTLTVPLANDPYAGVEYVVSPPSGQAMIVGVLSAQPVQMMDLPDVPPEVKNQSDALAFLANWANELRIPDQTTGQLRKATWSFDAKPYNIVSP
jgi:hypothetical protein